jgi:uncharacterized protein (TIGR02996 family)
VDRVAAAPEDLAPRLVLADWLLERGDPWGELIALQNRPADAAGAARLAALHADTSWLGALHDTFIRWRFERGLPVGFGNKGCYRHAWSDSRWVAAYAYELRFRVNGDVHVEHWELTDRAPAWRTTGRYALTSCEALRGRGAIPLRITYATPSGEREIAGVMRGKTITLDGMEDLGSPDGPTITLALKQKGEG